MLSRWFDISFLCVVRETPPMPSVWVAFLV
nr:MAG TPA: hypothetical protein [Caudoviricetes sp.]